MLALVVEVEILLVFKVIARHEAVSLKTKRLGTEDTPRVPIIAIPIVIGRSNLGTRGTPKKTKLFFSFGIYR